MQERGQAAPRVAVAMIVMRGKRLLLVQRRHHGHGSWCAPGGYLEPEEDLADGAVREVVEETGVRPGRPSFVAVTNDRFPDGKHNVTVWFAGRCDPAASPDRLSDEVMAADWFDPGAPPSPLYPSTAAMLGGRSLPEDAICSVVPGIGAPTCRWHGDGEVRR